jgi:hypothetical protein
MTGAMHGGCRKVGQSNGLRASCAPELERQRPLRMILTGLLGMRFDGGIEFQPCCRPEQAAHERASLRGWVLDAPYRPGQRIAAMRITEKRANHFSRRVARQAVVELEMK